MSADIVIIVAVASVSSFTTLAELRQRRNSSHLHFSILEICQDGIVRDRRLRPYTRSHDRVRLLLHEV